MDEPRPNVHFDHHSREFAADPWRTYEKLRSTCPVAFSETYGGFWVASKYQDVFAIARDDETFSSNREVVIPPTNVGRLIPLESDPPDQRKYRKLLAPYFGPQMVARLEGPIQQFTDRCLDSFIEAGRCDLVSDLATPVPAMTTLRLLGLPVEEWAAYAEPIHTHTYTAFDNPLNRTARHQIAELRERVAEELDRCRVEPDEWLLGHLVRAERTGDLTPREVLDLAMMVIFGGVDTTTATIGNALYYLNHNHHARRQLIEHPELMGTAVDEFLRYEAPILGFARTVTADCVIGGQQMQSGETVFMLWASANRDAEVFEKPDEVRLDRTPNHHMTFGIGGHRCLGAGLARAEIRIVLSRVLERIPEFSIVDDEVENPESIGIGYGRVRLPARFPASMRLEDVG